MDEGESNSYRSKKSITLRFTERQREREKRDEGSSGE